MKVNESEKDNRSEHGRQSDGSGGDSDSDSDGTVTERSIAPVEQEVSVKDSESVAGGERSKKRKDGGKRKEKKVEEEKEEEDDGASDKPQFSARGGESESVGGSYGSDTESETAHIDGQEAEKAAVADEQQLYMNGFKVKQTAF